MFTISPQQDVGGGSVQNGERHSLARIPLRWMIRECLKKSDIIFDKCMLEHEAGMDIGSLSKPPNPLSPENLHLTRPGDGKIKGFSFTRIPIAVASGVALPFRWVWGKLEHLHLKKSPNVVFDFDVTRFKYEGEPQEELKDALSPIYDQLDAHWYWTLMEWMPCESFLPVSGDELINGASKGIMKKQSAEVADSDDFWAYKLV